MSDVGITGGLDKIAISAQNAASGMEYILSVLDGVYDEIVLFQNAWKQWENLSFNFRANEISRQRSMGTISSEQEAQLWKELANAAEYGWVNAGKAEENYYARLYEHSKQWIADQTRLGNLSAEEVAQAWQRVFDKFDSINVKYEAAANIRSALLSAADNDVDARRRDSDRWMERQDLYDGGDYQRQYEDYQRRIAAETELLRQIESGSLNGVQLGAEEQKQKWLEVYEYIEDLQDAQYVSSKKYLDMQINDYVEACYKQLKEEYNLKQQQYSAELTAIDKHYNALYKKKKDTEREEELDELYRLKSYYENAVTKEGQDKLKGILSQIENIKSKQEYDDLEEQRQQEKDDVYKRIDESQKEYDEAKKKIDSLKTQMLDMTGEITRESNAAAITAGEGIKATTSFITQSVETMFGDSKARLEQYVADIFTILNPISGMFSTAAGSGNNINLTLNDYGDKNLADKNAVASYSEELVSLVKNTLRTMGM